MTTALITHSDCLEHKLDPGHPESPARIRMVEAALNGEEFQYLIREQAPLASFEDLELCHPQEHIKSIHDYMPTTGLRQLDQDTFASPGTWNAIMRSIGGALHGVDLVLNGEAKRAFVATRPAGHHAEKTKAMGFCFFGNIAIAAKHALERHGLSRVAVVDFDVHHGNGTQNLLWDEPRTLFVSSHQRNFYPFSGSKEETGAHDNVLNIPLKKKSRGFEMKKAYEEQVFPRLDAFKPELLLISAGFDAHIRDDMSGLMWMTDDFAWLTRRLLEVTAPHTGGKTVSILEGGYEMGSLADSVRAHVIQLSR